MIHEITLNPSPQFRFVHFRGLFYVAAASLRF